MTTSYPNYSSKPIFLPIDRNVFIDGIKNELLGCKLSDFQLECINLILNECELNLVGDLRHIAYIFSTAYHFTNNPFKPEQEILTPSVERASILTLKGLSTYPYYSRGYCPMRGKHLYRSESTRLEIDLEYNPDLLLTPSIAANSLVFGMSTGIYFGRRLDLFISGLMCDYNKASRVTGNIKNRFALSKLAVIFEKYLRKAAININF